MLVAVRFCSLSRVSRPIGLLDRPLVEASVKLSFHSAPIRLTHRSLNHSALPVHEQIRAGLGQSLQELARGDRAVLRRLNLRMTQARTV